MATSTKSSPASCAKRRASEIGLIPTCSPSAETSRTLSTRMSSLTLGSSSVELAIVRHSCVARSFSSVVGYIFYLQLPLRLSTTI